MTILAILQIISGIWDVLVGILLLLGFVVVGAFVGIGLISAALLVLALVAFGLAALSFVLAYGLWHGRGWAWVWSVIGAVLGLVLGILGLVVVGLNLETLVNIVPIVLYGIILIYLMTPNVRAFFGRTGGFTLPRPIVPPSPIAQPYPPPMAQPYPPPVSPQAYYPPAGYPQPAQPAGWGPTQCPRCGAPTQLGAYFCDRCGTRIR